LTTNEPYRGKHGLSLILIKFDFNKEKGAVTKRLYEKQKSRLSEKMGEIF